MWKINETHHFQSISIICSYFLITAALKTNIIDHHIGSRQSRERLPRKQHLAKLTKCLSENPRIIKISHDKKKYRSGKASETCSEKRPNALSWTLNACVLELVFTRCSSSKFPVRGGLCTLCSVFLNYLRISLVYLCEMRRFSLCNTTRHSHSTQSSRTIFLQLHLKLYLFGFDNCVSTAFPFYGHTPRSTHTWFGLFFSLFSSSCCMLLSLWGWTEIYCFLKLYLPF